MFAKDKIINNFSIFDDFSNISNDAVSKKCDN